MITIQPIQQNVLTTIRGLIDACGAQTFTEILSEVRNQCSGCETLEIAYSVVKCHLDYLIGLKLLETDKDDNGSICYGYESDF